MKMATRIKGNGLTPLLKLKKMQAKLGRDDDCKLIVTFDSAEAIGADWLVESPAVYREWTAFKEKVNAEASILRKERDMYKNQLAVLQARLEEPTEESNDE